uniref:Uncharacterized protein n=1 Tax=Grammatophora oceanica TaxID=210454 RepID=A0A7S1UNX1_9STRA
MRQSSSIVFATRDCVPDAVIQFSPPCFVARSRSCPQILVRVLATAVASAADCRGVVRGIQNTSFYWLASLGSLLLSGNNRGDKIVKDAISIHQLYVSNRARRIQPPRPVFDDLYGVDWLNKIARGITDVFQRPA